MHASLMKLMKSLSFTRVKLHNYTMHQSTNHKTKWEFPIVQLLKFLFCTLDGIKWLHVLLCGETRKRIESILVHKSNFRMNGFPIENFEAKSYVVTQNMHVYHTHS